MERERSMSEQRSLYIHLVSFDATSSHMLAWAWTGVGDVLHREAEKGTTFLLLINLLICNVI